MAQYELFSNGVYDNNTNQFIPDDPSNSQWLVYLAWVDEGGVPDLNSDLLKHKNNKFHILGLKQAEIIAVGVKISNDIFDATPALMTQFYMMQIAKDNGESITTPVSLNVFIKGGKLYDLCEQNYLTIGTSITNAVTIAAVDAIDINTGWPTVPYV